ncbi:MAG: hypothetical protein V1721_06850 [Pseudomonadota bacterium]
MPRPLAKKIPFHRQLPDLGVQLRQLRFVGSLDPIRLPVALEQRLRRLSPLGWDHINLTGDYVWSDSSTNDAEDMRPLNSEEDPLAP